jgi:hypothetical protein
MMKNIFIFIALFFPFMMIGQSIKSINPISASQGESIILSIAATNTTFKTGVNIVKLVNHNNNTIIINASSVSCVNDTLLNVAFSFGSNNNMGMYDVVVNNQQTNTTVQFPNSFNLKYTGPVLLSSAPVAAKQTDTVELTIKSSNTHFTQASNNQVYLQNPLNPYEIVQATSIKIIDNLTIVGKFIFTYFHSATDYDVAVGNSIDQTLLLKKAFKLNIGPFPPEIISISPNSANKLDSVFVTIKGKNTFFKRDSNLIELQGNLILIDPKKITYVNDTVMIAFFSFTNTEGIGKYDVVITNPFDNTNLKVVGGFTLFKSLKPPVLISFSPTNAEQGDSVLMTIKGNNTHFLKSATSSSIALISNNNSGMGAVHSDILNDTLIEAKFVFGYLDVADKYKLRVYDYIDSVLDAPDLFELKQGKTPPKLISVSPNNVSNGQKLDLLIKGTKDCFVGFYNMEIKLINNGYHIYPKNFVRINDSTLIATFEFQTSTIYIGYDLIVSDAYYPSRKLILPMAFTVNQDQHPPSLLSINPTSVNQFDTVLITVNASNSHFLNGSVNASAIASDNPANSIYYIYNSMKVMNDTTLQAKFVFAANYYSSTVYDVSVYSTIDGQLILKNALTLNRVYDQEPKIKDIDPKEALKGQSITLNIKGTSHSFLQGNNVVKLFTYGPNLTSIFPTSVNYINDSLISAAFSFDSTQQPGSYYLNVYNKSSLTCYNSFNLKEFPDVYCKLTAVDPPFASQKDTAMLTIYGSKTHFNSLSDNVWLQNKFGTKIKPIFMLAINDSTITVKFAFNNSNLPGVYSVYFKSIVDKTTMLLKDAFTLAGSINTTSLLNINPKYILCYDNFPSTITLNATNTHFMSDADTMIIVNVKSYDQHVIFPLKMNILNDTTISAKFVTGNYCGDFDVLVLGKENYILTGKLRAEPAVSVSEMPETPQVKIFPNPSEGVFTLNVNEDFEKADLIVFDMLGKIVFSEKKLEAITQIDLSNYPAGMYFVKLIKNNTCKTEKITKQ